MVAVTVLIKGLRGSAEAGEVTLHTRVVSSALRKLAVYKRHLTGPHGWHYTAVLLPTTVRTAKFSVGICKYLRLNKWII